MMKTIRFSILLVSIILWTQNALGQGLEVVAELSQGPGNIAVTPDRRLIVSEHSLFFSRIIE